MSADIQIKKRRKIDLAHVVATLALREPHSIGAGAEIFFELYRWLLLSATQKIRARGKTSDRYDGLFQVFESSRRSAVFGPDWRNEIAKMILTMLFDQHSMAVRWRREQKIGTTGTVVLTLPTASQSYTIEKQLDSLAKFRGRQTKAPVSNQHPEANIVTSVKIGLINGCWAMWATCSNSLEIQQNFWSGPIIKQKDKEPFFEFMARAIAETEALLLPPCPTPSAPINMSLPCFVGFTGTERETGREVVGGVAIDDVWKDIELPKPLVGEAFKFKGERTTIWQSPTLRKFHDVKVVELVEQPEDFWVFLPGAEKPSRLLVASCDDAVYLVVETSWKGGGIFGGGGSGGGGWAMINEHSAKRARARFLLHQDMYRRGFLYMGWREHQARKVDGILHPFPNGIQNGTCPRQKADAEQFCRDVRSVLWQYGPEYGCVFERANCVTGYEEGWHGDGEVTVVDRDDPPIADPAAKAEAVVQELHTRAVCARQSHIKPGGLFVLGVLDSSKESDSLFSIAHKPVFFDVEQGDYPNLGPKAIASDIIAREGRVVQQMFRSANVTKGEKGGGEVAVVRDQKASDDATD